MSRHAREFNGDSFASAVKANRPPLAQLTTAEDDAVRILRRHGQAMGANDLAWVLLDAGHELSTIYYLFDRLTAMGVVEESDLRPGDTVRRGSGAMNFLVRLTRPKADPKADSSKKIPTSHRVLKAINFVNDYNKRVSTGKAPAARQNAIISMHLDRPVESKAVKSLARQLREYRHLIRRPADS